MIATLPDAEQRQMMEASAAALQAMLPLDRLRAPDGAGAEARQWREMAALGWFGLAMPEAAGGAGASLAEEALLHREFGRVLTSPSLLAAGLAAQLALAAGDAALARTIVAGEQRIGIALARDAAWRDGMLSGDLLTFAAEDADLLLCWDEAQAALLAPARLTPLAPVAALDATVVTQLVRAQGVQPVLCVTAAQSPIGQRAGLLIAAQLAGMAEATGEQAVAYAKLREQFGKPIGAFQAVAHHCADMAMRARAARAQVMFAAIALRDGSDDAAFQLAAGALLAQEAAQRNAALAIRVHGAMGFTAASPLHHFLKRAHLLQALSAGRQAQLRALLEA